VPPALVLAIAPPRCRTSTSAPYQASEIWKSGKTVSKSSAVIVGLHCFLIQMNRWPPLFLSTQDIYLRRDQGGETTFYFSMSSHAQQSYCRRGGQSWFGKFSSCIFFSTGLPSISLATYFSNYYMYFSIPLFVHVLFLSCFTK
jgi:hypothetical protein